MNVLRAVYVMAVLCGSSMAVDLSAASPSAVNVPNGSYEPDPKKTWYAGETITIKEDKFHRAYFTDDLAHTPPSKEGSIRFFSDYILLDGLDRNPKRIPGFIDGVPVLWTVDAYGEWKNTRKVKDVGVLYLVKKPNQSAPPPQASGPRG
jgi:hypothetical protein